MWTVEYVRARDQRYYQKNKEAIMARRAAKAAIKAAMAPEKASVSVVNGWPALKTPSLNKIALQKEPA
jgi:hypothetical protein